MEEKKQDLLLEVVHPFAKDLSEVLKKSAQKAMELSEEEKMFCLGIVDELVKILLDAYKRDVVGKVDHYIGLPNFMKLIEIYLAAGSRDIDKVK